MPNLDPYTFENGAVPDRPTSQEVFNQLLKRSHGSFMLEGKNGLTSYFVPNDVYPDIKGEQGNHSVNLNDNNMDTNNQTLATNQLPPNHTGPNPVTPNIQGPAQNSSPAASQQKKQLLQKLMGHILNKPSSSVHETISNINDALGAYKNYAKEHDALHGIQGSGVDNMPVIKAPPANDNMPVIKAPPANDNMPVMGPNMAPRTMPILPHLPQMLPKAQAQPHLPNQGIPPSMKPMGQLQQPGHGPMPMPPMPPSQDQMIAGQPQQSSFNRPAPTNSLGIMGH